MPRGPQLVVIYWRDIPTQVNGMHRREKHQIQLHPRFMKAVDRAAMAAGITTHTAYIEQWRRDARSADIATLAEETRSLADEIEATHPLDELNRYVATGGWSPTTHSPIDAGSEPDPGGGSDPDGAGAGDSDGPGPA